MLAFLEDCPLGYENDAIIIEACDIEAAHASAALDTFYKLASLRQRSSQLNIEKCAGNFDALYAFYEEDNSKNEELEGKKKGLISKAWEAIKNLFRSIGNLFEKQGKAPEDGPEEVEVPSLLGEGINRIVSFIKSIDGLSGGAISAAALTGAFTAAKGVYNFIENEWEKDHGKSVKKQRKELLNIIDSCDTVIQRCEDITSKLGEAEDSVTAKEGEEAAEAKKKAIEELKELEDKPSSIFGWIRKALSKVGGWIKSARTLVMEKLGKKTSDGENQDGGDNKGSDDGNGSTDGKTDDNNKGGSEKNTGNNNGENKDDENKSEATDSGDQNADKNGLVQKAKEGLRNLGSKLFGKNGEGYFTKDGKYYKRDADGNVTEVSKEETDGHKVYKEDAESSDEFDLDTFFEELGISGDTQDSGDVFTEEEILAEANSILGIDNPGEQTFTEDEESEPWEKEINALYESLMEN